MPLVTAEKSTNLDLVRWAMMRAKVVLPTPGGPQKIIEPMLSPSMSLRKIFPSPKRCLCPTNSSKSRGRRRAAKGSPAVPSNIFICCDISASEAQLRPFSFYHSKKAGKSQLSAF